MGNDKKNVQLQESCNKPSARFINYTEQQRSVDKPSARVTSVRPTPPQPPNKK